MAGTASLTKLTFVCIILGMAGVAVSGCTLENVIDMTAGTSYLSVFAGQFKGRQVVVKGCGQPTVGRMAGTAIRTELAVVMIILGMAGIATLGGRFEICNTASAGMTASTDYLGMFPCQLERNLTMIKGVTICVNPIVAGQAVISIRLKVGLHEIGFDLLMTGCTDGTVEPGIASNMASSTSKRRTVRLALVGLEGISESLM